jgi:hypothetical protein
VADSRSPLSDPSDLSARAAIFNIALTPNAWAQEADKAGYFTVVIGSNDWNGAAEPEFWWPGGPRTETA